MACCCLVAKSCLTLGNAVDSSMSDFPVLHTLLSLLKLMSLESVMPSMKLGDWNLLPHF